MGHPVPKYHGGAPLVFVALLVGRAHQMSEKFQSTVKWEVEGMDLLELRTRALRVLQDLSKFAHGELKLDYLMTELQYQFISGKRYQNNKDFQKHMATLESVYKRVADK